MDTGIAHTHHLIVWLYLLQLLVRIVLMIASKKEMVEKYTKMMRIPHIVLACLMLGTGIYLMVKAPEGTQPYILVKIGLVLASVPLGIVGSKRASTPLTVLGFMLLASVMALAYTKPEFLRSSSSVEIDPAKAGENGDALKQGQALYQKYCVLCHGADGAAGFQGAKDLRASTFSDIEIVNIIQKGKGVMPPNTDLSEIEAEQVKDYVKYLRK